MASAIFNSFKRDIANGSIDLDTDTINVMLVGSSFTPDVDAMSKRSSVTSFDVGGDATHKALANKTVTVDNANNRAIFDADDVVWAGATITARGAVLYKSRGGADTADELIAFIDFGSDISSTAADFTLAFNAAGILALT